MILLEAHEGVLGGHYARKETTHKKNFTGLWWPTLHNDAKEFCHTYDVCQRVGKPYRRDEMPLIAQVMLHAFDKWALDFIGLINYLTRWAEGEPIRDCSAEIAAQFLFGCSRILMSD